jgi:predicted methyltransferase
MRSNLISSIAFALVVAGTAACATAAPAPTANDAYIVLAVSDPARPQADKDRDVNRKPAEMVAFAGVKPGMVVADMIPGGGYFTRIFSKSVGPTGKVYAIAGAPRPGQPPPLDALVKDAANYANLTVVSSDFQSIAAPSPVDIAWTSQNYHDLKNRPAPFEIAKFNKAVYDMLKPGGIYIVLDHSAKTDAADDVTNKMHRIKEATVKTEVLAAGFKLVGSSDAVRDPADTRDVPVFDGNIRGKTDQFVLKFQKPS